MRVIYIGYNSVDPKYPNSPSDGSRCFTYGFAARLARRFKKFNPDWEVHCWKCDPRTSKIISDTIEGVQFKVFPSIDIKFFGQISYSLLKSLKKFLTDYSQTIVNVSSIRHALFYSVALIIEPKYLVVQHHGEASAKYKYDISGGVKKYFYALQIPLEKLALKKVRLFYVLDREFPQVLPSSIKNIVFKQQTVGVDSESYLSIPKDEARLKIGVEINGKYILYIGRLSETKRPDILLEVFNFLKNEIAGLKLIIGGCQQNEKYYSAAREAGAILFGSILQEEIQYYLSAADVYVLPGYQTDHRFGGIGLLPIESMLCNTPYVGVTLRNLPQEDTSEVGVYANDVFTLKESIRTVLNNKDKFHSGRSIAIKYYSWESICQQTRLDYENIIK